VNSFEGLPLETVLEVVVRDFLLVSSLFPNFPLLSQEHCDFNCFSSNLSKFTRHDEYLHFLCQITKTPESSSHLLLCAYIMRFWLSSLKMRAHNEDSGSFLLNMRIHNKDMFLPV
jgi:hypothetical protein